MNILLWKLCGSIFKTGIVCGAWYAQMQYHNVYREKYIEFARRLTEQLVFDFEWLESLRNANSYSR